MSRSVLLCATVLLACLCVLSSSVSVSAGVSQTGPADQSLEGVLEWLLEDNTNSTINYLSSDELYSLAEQSDINIGASTAPNATEEDVLVWNAWKANNNKQYASPSDESARFLIFLKNAAWIEQANMKAKADAVGTGLEAAFYVLGPYADIHHDEFAEMYLNPNLPGMLAAEMADIPVVPASDESMRLYSQSAEHPGLLGNLDWRGLCTAVKNQGGCGSCWAFSATETIESATAKAGRGLHELSPQQVIDCSGGGGSKSCKTGGSYYGAFNYFKGHGTTSAGSYPYVAHNEGCRMGSGGGPRVRNTGFPIQPCQGGGCGGQNENGMASGLGQYGPLSIMVAAGVWQHYGGGVLTPGSGCSSNWSDLNHAVQLVGAINGVWLVRNSWGGGWGEGGYIRIQMMHNICGLANYPMFVTV